jgi:hypothetical protein
MRIFRTLHIYDRIRLPLGILAILVGLSMWQIRADYVAVPTPDHGELHLAESVPLLLGNREDLCSKLSQDDGYILLSGSITLNSLGSSLGFFESAESENGLFFEYDPGEGSLVRLGVRLSDGSIARIRFTSLKQAGTFSYLILLTGRGDVLMRGDGVNESTTIGPISIVCDNWSVGSANGSGALDGSMSLAISTGLDPNSAKLMLDDYVSAYKSSLPSETYKVPLYFGLFLLILGNPFKYLPRKSNQSTAA